MDDEVEVKEDYLWQYGCGGFVVGVMYSDLT